jgi:hypothetical protein
MSVSFPPLPDEYRVRADLRGLGDQRPSNSIQRRALRAVAHAARCAHFNLF